MTTKYANVQTVYKNFPELKKENVQMLGDWAKMQPHLPEVSELQLTLFLHSCMYNNETAKVCMDNFYSTRALCPEFFANRNPNNDEITSQIKVGLSVLMSEKTPEGIRVVYSNIIDTNADRYVYHTQIKLEDMLIQITQALQGPANGYFMVIDCKGGTLSHLSKFGLLTTKKLLYYLQECIPVRLLQIHLVNVVPVVDMFMTMAKPFLKKELNQKLHFHKTADSLLKIIPKQCLPNNIGGTGGVLSDLYEQTMKTLRENVPYFLEEEKLVADESKRPGKPRSASELFGAEGTFKKLSID